MSGRTCTYCPGDHFARDMCQRHYRRWQRGQPLEGGRRKPGPKPRLNQCGHPERPHCARGMCAACYQRDRRAGSPRP